MFSLEGLSYGVDATKVREILTFIEPTRLPNTKKWISGVINIRGEVTPIIDLRVRFHTASEPKYNENTPIIAVKTDDGRMIGMIADGIDTLVEVGLEAMIEMPFSDMAISGKYIRGIFLIEEKNIAVVDTDILLSRGELE